MRLAYLPSHPAKQHYRQLVQRCGFGAPNLDRALWTVANSLTLVVQGTLQPFQKDRGRRPSTRDMHLHRLPWPQNALEALSDTEVEMRVTLSYFIEPNPSQRGNSRYRYQSHGLRFDVKRPTETSNAFRAPYQCSRRKRRAKHRDFRPPLAPRRQQSASGIIALGYLARHRPRNSRAAQRWPSSDDWLVAGRATGLVAPIATPVTP